MHHWVSCNREVEWTDVIIFHFWLDFWEYTTCLDFRSWFGFAILTNKKSSKYLTNQWLFNFLYVYTLSFKVWLIFVENRWRNNLSNLTISQLTHSAMVTYYWRLTTDWWNLFGSGMDVRLGKNLYILWNSSCSPSSPLLGKYNPFW